MILCLLLVLLPNDSFVADASADATYIVNVSREALKGFADDVGLFERNMPGVLGVKDLGDGTYLYRTEKEIPLKGAMAVDFHIQKFVYGDSVTIYRSADVHAVNYMSCRVSLRAHGEHQTAIGLSLRIRMERENPGEIHWLAPVLGEQFISDRMKEDLESMIGTFIVNSTRELSLRFAQTSSRN